MTVPLQEIRLYPNKTPHQRPVLSLGHHANAFILFCTFYITRCRVVVIVCCPPDALQLLLYICKCAFNPRVVSSADGRPRFQWAVLESWEDAAHGGMCWTVFGVVVPTILDCLQNYLCQTAISASLWEALFIASCQVRRALHKKPCVFWVEHGCSERERDQ